MKIMIGYQVHSQLSMSQSALTQPGSIFTKCNRIRKTGCFYSSNSNKTLSLSINRHRLSSLAKCLRFDFAKVFDSTLTFAIFVLEVVVARFNSWDHFFPLTLGSKVRFRG